MATFRIRIVKSNKSIEFPFLIQVSLDGLVWFPIKEAKTLDSAIGYSKDIMLVYSTRMRDHVEIEVWRQDFK